MFVLYLIQNDSTLEKYIGVTENLEKRLTEHNNKGKKFTTRKKGLWILIYAEAYRSKQDALKRERKLKKHAGGKYQLLKRLEDSLIA